VRALRIGKLSPVAPHGSEGLNQGRADVISLATNPNGFELTECSSLTSEWSAAGTLSGHYPQLRLGCVV
jgi:hypothetical protein